MRNYDEGSNTGYVAPPVPCAWVKWIRGDAKLISIAKTDPGAYFGGWRAFLEHKERNSSEKVENPKLPLPVVTRVSQDGKNSYDVYATNVLNFVPLQWRLRYEFREKVPNAQTGKEDDKVVATSASRKPGYQPHKQIFGLVFSDTTDEYAPALLFIPTWSAFISMNNAANAWKTVKVPEGLILVRRYGSIGVKDAKGRVMPKFEEFNKGFSTPIDAIDISNPRFIKDSPEFDKLFDDSIAWKECSRWNAEGKVQEDLPEGNQYLAEFDRVADEMGLSNIEKAALVKEAQGDYQKALASLNFGADQEPSEEDINQELAKGDLHE